jgi:hypothetical protein
MKRAIVIFLATVGVLAIALLAFRIGAGSLSYEERVRAYFGSPDAIRSLAKLYERVESDGKTLEPAGARVRAIPRNWLPQESPGAWGFYYGEASRVIAHFDERGALVAIEFDGSRDGCYVSRDATRCPASFASLQRLAKSPLYVTGRVAAAP